MTPPRQPSLLPGQEVCGRYRIVRFVDRGGMGEVYEAEDLELKSRIALKTLLPAAAGDSRMVARFKQEIQLARKISHPNVCRVFDLVRHPAEDGSGADTVFLTMEFLDGETLSARLRREKHISPEEALPLLSQMADALEAAHTAGIIHRDLKPSNVILVPQTAGTRAVVTDFGLARNVSPASDSTLSLTGQVMGTFDFMAPELLDGHAATYASDVYALGTVAYQMVTGQLPFAAETPMASAMRRSKGTAPSPRLVRPELDACWERALARALDPDPAARYASSREFVQELSGESASVTVTIRRWSPLRAIAAVVTLVLLVGAVFVWRTAIRGRNQPSPEGLKWYQAGTEALRDATYYRAARALERAVSVDPGFALGHARLAEAWNEIDDSDKANQEMLVALEDEANRPPQRKSDTLYVEAIHRTLAGDFPSAITKYNELGGSVPKSEKPQVLVDLGRALERNLQISRALEAYNEAARLDPQNAAAHLRAAILLGLRMRRLPEAEGEFAKAYSLYEALSNTEGQVEVLFQRGVLATTGKKFQDARADLEKAIQTAHVIATDYQEIAATLQLSSVTYQQGDAKRAEQMAAAAVEWARRVGKANLAARGLTDLALARFGRSDYLGAEATLREAIDLARRNRLHRNEARALLQLASIHLQQGDVKSALQEAEPALAYYRQAGFALETTQALTAVARAHRDLGQNDKARTEFEQLLTRAKATGETLQILTAEQGMASFFFQTDQWPQALEHYEKHSELARQVNDRAATGIGLVNRAKLLWRLGRYQDAEAVLQEAEGMLNVDVRLPGLVEGVRAEMALSQGQYAAAQAHARKTIEMASATKTAKDTARCVDGLAKLRSGVLRNAARPCEQAVDAATTLGDQFSLLDYRLALAEIVASASDPQTALDAARQARVGSHGAGRKELEWRAWVVEARALRRSGDTAGAGEAAAKGAACLAELHSEWGDSVFASYSQRKDIQSYLREIVRTVK
ncbi:MAG TPA: tetratricopeptide repeat protein [Candidatus Limnocylindrales bacterium]|nr:tetratricopeptide repeat protein [Candidatus Limnocylindrales bacterium]